MSLFFETIKIQDGVVRNPGYHLERFNRTRLSFFPEAPLLDLTEWIKIPSACANGVFKCRVTYGEEIENIEFEKYALPKITSLKRLADDDIEYSFKYKNRFQLTGLLGLKGDDDDILIVKNNRVTDSSFSNLVFQFHGKWYTPKYPLLKGTKREQLLGESLIIETDIKTDDLGKFEKAGLINAMIDLNECLIEMKNIH